MGECLAFPANQGDEDSPLIPEGKYLIGYVDHSTWLFMGRQPKVAIRFQIITPGDYFGVVLTAYYNVKRMIGKAGKNGRFKANKRSNLVRDYCRIFPFELLPRLDRLPLTKIGTVLIEGKVETVKQGFDQRAIPEPAQYSVIRRIGPDGSL